MVSRQNVHLHGNEFQSNHGCTSLDLWWKSCADGFLRFQMTKNESLLHFWLIEISLAGNFQLAWLLKEYLLAICCRYVLWNWPWFSLLVWVWKLMGQLEQPRNQCAWDDPLSIDAIVWRISSGRNGRIQYTNVIKKLSIYKASWLGQVNPLI